jgi:hypothetical protein
MLPESISLDIAVSAYQSRGMRITVTLDTDVYEVGLSLKRFSGE